MSADLDSLRAFMPAGRFRLREQDRGPAGSEGYFAERAHLAAVMPDDVDRDYAGLDPRAHDELRDRYGIEIIRPDG